MHEACGLAPSPKPQTAVVDGQARPCGERVGGLAEGFLRVSTPMNPAQVLALMALWHLAWAEWLTELANAMPESEALCFWCCRPMGKRRVCCDWRTVGD